MAVLANFTFQILLRNNVACVSPARSGTSFLRAGTMLRIMKFINYRYFYKSKEKLKG